MAQKVTQLKQGSVNPLDAIVSALIKRGENYDEFENIEVGDEEAQAIAEHVVRDFEDTRGANQQFYDNMIEMTKNWRGTTDEKNFPFEESSNLRVPMTSAFVEQTKARFLKALFGSGQFSKISSVDDLIKGDNLKGVNDWFDWELREIVKLKKTVKDAIHNVLINGIGLIVPNYEYRTRMLRSKRRFDFDAKQPIDLQLTQAIETILSTPTTWAATRDEDVTVTSQSDHGVYKLSDGGEITFSLVTRQGKQELCAEVFRKETIYDAAKLRNLNLEDVVTPNSAATVDDIPFFGYRYFDTVQDFRQLWNDGYYNCSRENADRVAKAADIKIGDYFQQDQSKEQDREEGTDSRDLSAYRPNRLWIEVYHWEGWWVWDKSGSPYTRDKAMEPATQVAFWVCPRTRQLIKVARLEDLNKDGKRSPVKFDFILEPNRFISIGMAEWLRHVQAELDAIHNQRIDAGLLTNAPFGFYEPAMGMKKEVLKIEPGTLKPVKNPQGVYFPPLNWQPKVSMQDEEMVWTYAQGQASITGQAMGVPISKRQSASEFAGTSAALDLRTEMVLDGFIDSFRELIYRILGLYQQFGPRQRMYRLQGDDGERYTKHVELDRLQGRMEIELASNLAQVDNELKKKTAMDMLGLLMNQILISLGIVGPDTIWGAVDQLVKAHGYKGVPIHKPDVAIMSDSPSTEHERIAAGLPVGGPNQSENFNEHLQAHLMLASDPHLAEKLSPEAQKVLGDHIKQTAEMQRQVAILRSLMAAQAVGMAQELNAKGIRPGQPGGQQPGDNTEPGTQAEGVENAAA